MEHWWKNKDNHEFYQDFELPEEIEILMDSYFLTSLKRQFRQRDPKTDFDISEIWSAISGSYFWTEAFEATVAETGYEELNNFWKNLNYSFYIDIFFDCFCIKAEELGITTSGQN